MRRIAAGLVGIVLLLALAGCSPKGSDCKQEGDMLYTSQYGDFVCKPGTWFGKLRWEEA